MAADAPARTSLVYTWEPSNAAIARRYGLRPDQILRFDTNTSPVAPDALVAARLAQAFDPALNEYPDSSYEDLALAAAAYNGVAVDRIVVGAGADEVLDLVGKAFLPAGGAALVPTPTYGMYGVLTTQRGARVVAVPRLGWDAGFAIDLDRLVPALAGVAGGLAVRAQQPHGRPSTRASDRCAILPATRPPPSRRSSWSTRPTSSSRAETLVLLSSRSPEPARGQDRLQGVRPCRDPHRLRHRIAARDRAAGACAAAGHHLHGLGSPRHGGAGAAGRGARQRRAAVRGTRLARRTPGRRRASAVMPSVTNFLLVRIGDARAADALTDRMQRRDRAADLRAGEPASRAPPPHRPQPRRERASPGGERRMTPEANATTISTAGSDQAERGPPPGPRCDRSRRPDDITVELDLDGTGVANIRTGIGIYDHLLESFAHHALIDLTIEATGDLERDEHHTVEDVALALGQALAEALGDRAGITRFGDASVPMDEAIARAVVDLSGRPYAVLDLRFRGERIGELSTQMIPHALESFVRTSGVTLHLRARGPQRPPRRGGRVQGAGSRAAGSRRHRSTPHWRSVDQGLAEMTTVALVDYGAGNPGERIGASTGSVRRATSGSARGPAELRGAALVVVPGVGASGPAMRALRRRGPRPRHSRRGRRRCVVPRHLPWSPAPVRAIRRGRRGDVRAAGGQRGANPRRAAPSPHRMEQPGTRR